MLTTFFYIQKKVISFFYPYFSGFIIIYNVWNNNIYKKKMMEFNTLNF